jgi:hypothetical protein
MKYVLVIQLLSCQIFNYDIANIVKNLFLSNKNEEILSVLLDFLFAEFMPFKCLNFQKRSNPNRSESVSFPLEMQGTCRPKISLFQKSQAPNHK